MYGLTHKVTATVTDNGSNFDERPVPGSDDEETDDEEVTFTDVGEALSDSDGQYSLPPHLRCASHTLNLISKDVQRNLQKWTCKVLSIVDLNYPLYCGLRAP